MSEIGRNYGGALYLLACETQAEAQILRELELLQGSFSAEPDFVKLLALPALPKQERTAILDESFSGKLHPYTLNFLKLLTENGTIRAFPDCVGEFRRRYYADNGILPVTAVTAVPLTGALRDRLREKLAAITGKQIVLTERVDASVLGGVRLQTDGAMLEDTARARLDALRRHLTQTVLSEVQ